MALELSSERKFGRSTNQQEISLYEHLTYQHIRKKIHVYELFKLSPERKYGHSTNQQRISLYLRLRLRLEINLTLLTDQQDNDVNIAFPGPLTK